MAERNIKDLGYSNGWSADSLESRLVDMAREAGYQFKQVSHNERGTDTIYECREAGLRYHIDSSD